MPKTLLNEWQTADPDHILQNKAYDLGLHCLLRIVCLNTYGKYGDKTAQNVK